MKIFVEGSTFETEGRGISKSTAALYTAINKIYPDIEISLLSQKELVCPFCPRHESIQPNHSIWSSLFSSRKKYLTRSLPKKVKKLSPDFIHFPSNGFHSTFFKNVQPRTKIISTIHDIIPIVIPQIYGFSDEYIAQYYNKTQSYLDVSNIVVVDSEHTKQDLLNHFECKSEPVVLYFAPYLEKPSHSTNSFGDYFLYNGGYCPRKGMDHLVDNFLQLKLRGKLQSKLILTGTIIHLSTRLKALIQYGISKQWIIETKYISDSELANLYSHAIALVYPSIYEGFGMPPLEAMNLGCPVITTKLTSLPEVCGDAVYYINRENDSDFQQALVTLENNKELRHTLIEKGLKQAQKFSWNRSATKFIELLNNCKENK